jgi:hypothetical protein
MSGPTGTRRYKNTFYRLAVPTPACTPTATYVTHFFQANFEMHPNDMEMQLKIGRPQLDL